MKQRAETSSGRRFERYVAIGDSSTEGLEDPDGQGGYRGWSTRLVERLALAQGSIEYANLAVRGRRTRRILEEQLEPALALRPDLATLFAGTNDVVASQFDLSAVAADLELMHGSLTKAGATVLTFTLPDLSPVMPLARAVWPRVQALNEALRGICARSGSLLVDLAAHPVASDPRLWSDDRLHANSAGHERIAAALAHALGLPGTNQGWSLPLEESLDRGILQLLGAEIAWVWRFLVPWVWRHSRGISSGDGRSAKQPDLVVIEATALLDASDLASH
ncbi:MAG: SGNH/GDSL hydrolase family protein [Deltaproteobacteria bacterium]|nr:SGNH/GDSL hydrolase family protein [Deltaproteobacteria bacterium]